LLRLSLLFFCFSSGIRRRTSSWHLFRVTLITADARSRTLVYSQFLSRQTPPPRPVACSFPTTALCALDFPTPQAFFFHRPLFPLKKHIDELESMPACMVERVFTAPCSFIIRFLPNKTQPLLNRVPGFPLLPPRPPPICAGLFRSPSRR